MVRSCKLNEKNNFIYKKGAVDFLTLSQPSGPPVQNHRENPVAVTLDPLLSLTTPLSLMVEPPKWGGNGERLDLAGAFKKTAVCQNPVSFRDRKRVTTSNFRISGLAKISPSIWFSTEMFQTTKVSSPGTDQQNSVTTCVLTSGSPRKPMSPLWKDAAHERL